MFDMSASYIQNGDVCTSNDINTLKIETENSGDGCYYVVSTERFAFNDTKELVEILTDFIDRFTPTVDSEL